MGAGVVRRPMSGSAVIAAHPLPAYAPMRSLTGGWSCRQRRQWPSGLAGGQKQRVGAARALVAARGAGVRRAAQARRSLTRCSMQRLGERVWQEQAFTVDPVTMTVREAVALADRILVIEDGPHRPAVMSTFRAPPAWRCDFAGAGRFDPAHLLRSADDSASP